MAKQDLIIDVLTQLGVNMKSIPELRARKAYVNSLTIALESMIIEVCSDALEVSGLRSLLLEYADTKSAVDVGFDIELKYYDAAWCLMHSRATQAIKLTGGIGMFLSGRQRQKRAQLILILQHCIDGLYASFGLRTAELIRVFENNAEVHRRQRSQRIIRMTFTDGTGTSWDPVEREEAKALRDADRENVEHQYDVGEIDEDEYRSLLRELESPE